MELYFNGRNLLIIVGYYLIINLILYFTMVIDKKMSHKGWVADSRKEPFPSGCSGRRHRRSDCDGLQAP